MCAAPAALAAEAVRPAMSPASAIAALMEGNHRFVAQRLTSFEADLAVLRRHTEESQAPFAAVLSCADSRVPVELVFDQSIGHLFVVRVAGNVASAEAIASLEYGAAVLGCAAIMVLGHSGCGAVQAAIANKAVPGQISNLYAPLRPAVDAGHGDMAATVAANAAGQAHLLGAASPVLAGLIGEGRLRIVASVYHLGTGVVSLLA
jgi:carbonic anhydrase